ncbi:MAG: hypothetical protein JSW66_12795 [Phycisphaerales bacterium]|nr:MAG: hypothetical protein JSW66_12795 [Phycisphaerales bacterium]
MRENEDLEITDFLGRLPYRIALAGGWIDQPFASKHNPSPPGSMVVVCVEPQFRFMERAGICIGTRQIALELWKGRVPKRDPDELVQELYAAENEGRTEPSGSQDMIGLVYPGISRLDYDYAYRGGVFPRHVESNTDPQVASWLERVIHILPVAPRPEGYNPLETRNLLPDWIARLGQSGKACYNAIVNRDTDALGASMNECMQCWETILPGTVRHRTLKLDLLGLLKYYQARYRGAMYSGCGGGYLYVVSESPVPGAFHIKVRTKHS